MSNFTITLTPGYIWQPGELWTADKANMSANPVVNLTGSISGAVIGSGAVGLANLQTGMFTANSAGYAPFAANWLPLSLVGNGIFTANTAGWAPFAAGWLPLSLVGSGIFTATPAGRAPFLTGGTAASGLVNAAMIQPDALNYAVGSGTSAAYVVAFNPTLGSYLNAESQQAFTSYWDGLQVVFKAPATNTLNGSSLTTLTCLSVSGTAVQGNIYMPNGQPITAGTILANSTVEVRWNSTFNSGSGGWQLMGGASTYATPSASYQSASTSAFGLSLAHNLGVVPSMVRWVLVCQNSEAGFAAGAEIDVLGTWTVNESSTGWATVGADSANVYISRGGAGWGVYNASSGTGVNLAVTGSSLANWKLKAYARV